MLSELESNESGFIESFLLAGDYKEILDEAELVARPVLGS